MDSPPFYLAVDLGSTHFKAGVFNGSLSRRSAGLRPLPTRRAPGGRVEIEPADVLDALAGCIGDALASSRTAGDEVRAIAVTSQAQTFTVLGPEGGPRIPFISWQDCRATETAREMARLPMFAEFAEHASFADILPNLQICLLHHLAVSRPGTVRTSDTVMPLSAFVVKRLCGNAFLDRNLAAMTGLYSMETGNWWDAALDYCGLRTTQLPELHPIGAVAARTDDRAADFGIPSGIPVVLAGNDQTAGAYAAGLHETGAVLLTLGTAQIAYTCTPSLPPPSPGLVRGPYPGGRFYRMAADTCGGNVVDWARTMLRDCTSFEDFFKTAAAAPPGCHGLRFAPDVPSGGGCWENIALNHGPPHFARAVIEGLARRLRHRVHELVGTDRVQYLLAGGGNRQPLWVRILEETLEAEITVTGADPCTGAAAMARDALD
ncbi:MAG: hypothetical protein GXP31_02220 [Kiritimatiellaeota bacterium]|nr:hypothetical protein [Kiritimatiellota bacterium]